MAETFDCPKCGAPVKFTSLEQAAAGTVSCVYCGDTILIPEQLRPIPPEPVRVLDNPKEDDDPEVYDSAYDRFRQADREMADTDDLSVFKAADIEKTKKHSAGYVITWVLIGISPIIVLILVAACLILGSSAH